MAVRDVRHAGLIPDMIACRCERPLERSTMEKIAHFAQVEVEQVLAVRDMPSIYQVPVLLEEQGLLKVLRNGFKLDELSISPLLTTLGDNIWSQWKGLTMTTHQSLYDTVNIVLVGKYIELHDSYMSVVKSLEHSAMRCRRKLNLIWVDAEHLEPQYQERDPARFHKAWHEVCTAHGILVPGGFGQRGTEGMMKAAKWARENKRPYLGVCLGMQVAVIEYARDVCNIAGASSEEFSKDGQDNVIVFMPEIDKTTMGGTMRLGARPTQFQPGSEWSRIRALYGEKDAIIERHRHRYEVNPKYIEQLEAAGLTFIGKDDTGVRMEIIELKEHPYFVGVQYHPEYLSRVLNPSKPYLGLVAASAGCLEQIIKEQLVEEKMLTVNGKEGINGHTQF